MEGKRVFYSEWAYALGIIVLAIVNGWLIERISNFLKNNFAFQDAFNWSEKFN